MFDISSIETFEVVVERLENTRWKFILCNGCLTSIETLEVVVDRLEDTGRCVGGWNPSYAKDA